MHNPSRPYLWAAFALAALFFGANPAPSRAVAVDVPDLNGTWKFLQISLADNELFIIDVKSEEGALSAKIVEKPPTLQSATVRQAELKGDLFVLTLRIAFNTATFSGKLPKGKDKPTSILGTLRIGSETFPCRLEKTDDKVLTQARPDDALIQTLLSLRNERDPKVKVEKLGQLVHGAPGHPKFAIYYAELIKSAVKINLPSDQIRKYVEEWIQGSEPYGDEYTAHVSTQALKVLAGQKAFAELSLQLGEKIEKGVGEDTPLETRAEVSKALALAAKLAGRAELAEKEGAKSAKLEAEIDAEYHKKVPPFKTEVYGGRKAKEANRVVLLELFTGAECAPCVAADVAFDGLNTTYKPTELITLQYHLHNSGPDPLTNTATMLRMEYYPDLGGTPASYFNGRLQAYGGGPMVEAKEKYEQYRQIIDKNLETKSQAKIDLQVHRKGDELQIVARAQSMRDVDKPARKAVDEDAPKKGELKLRLVLSEKQIRYVGGNMLRFHHHVVRAMPGGPDGKTLRNGQGETKVLLKLSETRRELETFLSDFSKEGSDFPNPLPAIALKDLTVVAFVQDDGDKSVLNAVAAPVPQEKSEAMGE